MIIRLIYTCFLLDVVFTMAVQAKDLSLEKLVLPPGFSISVYAEVKNARQMTLGKNGTVYVGSRRQGQVYALLNPDNKPAAEKVVVIDSGLTMPSGVTYRDGDLYVADIGNLYRYKDIDNNYDKNPEPELLSDKFPDKSHHGWKFIKFGPDGHLYIPVGAPCNICFSEDPVFGTITRMDVDSADRTIEIYARGVRNTVGFDWHPDTGNLWFTDNGGDGLGDNIPADELNRVTKNGQHFGYPFFHQGDIPDKKLAGGKDAEDYTPPTQKLGSHVAALGMTFYTGKMFPERFHNQIIIPEHGSWNRTKKAGHVGYRLTLITLEGNKVVKYEPFITGWLDKKKNKGWGRPAATLVMSDGSLLVADDRADVVYRVTYKMPD